MNWDDLPELLAGHTRYVVTLFKGVRCADENCWALLTDSEEPTATEAANAHAAHVATVVRDWVEGQMTEEWGLAFESYVGRIDEWYYDKPSMRARLSAGTVGGMKPFAVIHRHVTETEDVEDVTEEGDE